jgi:hypothetical protein
MGGERAFHLNSSFLPPIINIVNYKYLIIAFFILLSGCKGAPTALQTPEDAEENIHYLEPGDTLPVSEFKEIWTYVLAGNRNSEAALIPGLPITDVGYFGATVGMYGNLVDIPNRSRLNFRGRVHLVATCDGGTRSYFVLRQGSAERRQLIADLIEAAKNYDGLQIDFENVPERSLEDYQSFIRELRSGLPRNKMLTLALAARTRKLTRPDVYDYEALLPYVDRILIMAYDQHWSGSDPGPVAAINWCKNVAEYCYGVIGQEKLIMGLPFYGRAWGDYNPSRALIYNTIDEIIKEHHANVRYENGIPVFTYEKNVSIKLYFDNEYSLTTRLQMYKDMNINAVGFWRQGQETAEIWKYLKVSE